MTSSDDAMLLPCPFCGGEANGDGYASYSRPLPDTQWADGSEITEAFFVNCVKCGIDNGRPGLVGGYQTKAEAIEAWNTRPSPIGTGDVERVARALSLHRRNRARVALGHEPLTDDPRDNAWKQHVDDARAAIAALQSTRQEDSSDG